MAKRRLVRRKGEQFVVDLPDWMRTEIGNLLGQLRELLTSGAVGDDRLTRLFPPAYLTDDKAEAEYQGFMRGELVTSRLSAIEQIESSLFDERLDQAQLTAWMAGINDVRLVLGTLLGVTEELDVSDLDQSAPEFAGFVLYDQLTFVLSEIIDALAGAL